jgi:hypothetical protein
MRGNKIWRLLSAAALFCFALGLVLVPQQAVSKSPQTANSPQSDVPVPAYHAEAPQGALPAAMDPELFPDPMVRNAYAIAARMKKTLYQLPCYCHCDRSQGHGSLLDCFVSKHGSGCNICMNENFYSYEQSRKGRTAAEIRAGIIRGEWQSVNTTKYQKPRSSK